MYVMKKLMDVNARNVLFSCIKVFTSSVDVVISIEAFGRF